MDVFFFGGGGGAAAEEYSWDMKNFSFVNIGTSSQCSFILENAWFSWALPLLQILY